MTQEQDYSGSQITVCLAVKLLSLWKLNQRKRNTHVKEAQTYSVKPSTPRKSRSSTPLSFIHAVMDPDDQSTSTSSRRQALGSTLCPWFSTAAKVSGQTLWSGTTPCQQPLSDSCCCLTNLHTWETSTESQADSRHMTGKKLHVYLCAPSLPLHVERAVFFNGPSDERCSCRSQASKLAGVKNGFYCCSMTDLIALPSEV